MTHPLFKKWAMIGLLIATGFLTTGSLFIDSVKEDELILANTLAGKEKQTSQGDCMFPIGGCIPVTQSYIIIGDQ